MHKNTFSKMYYKDFPPQTQLLFLFLQNYLIIYLPSASLSKNLKEWKSL